MYVYDYMQNSISPDLLHRAEDIRLYRNLGVKGVTSDPLPEAHTGFSYLRFYLWMKLLWNSDYEEHRGMREFLAAYYGAAAPYLKSFIDFQDNHDSWLRRDPAQLLRSIGGYRSPYGVNIVPPLYCSSGRSPCRCGK